MRRIGIAGIVLAAACGTGGTDDDVPSGPGQVVLCLETDADVEPVLQEAYEVWEVEGTVSALDPTTEAPSRAPFACLPDKGRSIELLTSGGERWRLAWYATSENVDRSPDVHFAVGEALTLTFAHLADFADDRVVALADAKGLRFAAEEGRGGRLQELTGDVLRGVRVEHGADDASRFYETDCGQQIGRELAFSAGDASVEAATWEEATLDAGAFDLQVRNVGARKFIGEITCTDVGDTSPWILWR